MKNPRILEMKSILRQHWGVIFLSCAALASIAVQAFITTPRNDGLVEVYFADRMTDAHRILIDRYNTLHEGKVKVVPIDFPNEEFTTNERKEVLARLLRGQGEGIDVFAVDRIWVQRFERWCEHLEPYFSAEELNRLTATGLHSCYKGGSLVALPLFNVVEALIYRRDLLLSLPGGSAMEARLQAGITWEDFLDFARRRSFSGPYYVYPAAEYEGLICSFNSILLGIDPRYYEKHGFDFDTKEARRSLQLLVDLVNRYGVTPKEATTMTEVPGYEYYVRRNGLFVFGWTNFRKDMNDLALSQATVRLVPPPHFSDGQQAATIGGWSLMVSRTSTKIDQSVDFIKFLLTPESQEVLLTKGGFSPVVKIFYDDTSYVARYPELAEFRLLEEQGVHRPSDEHYTRYSEILASYCSQSIRMKIGVQEALRQATEQIKAEGLASSTDPAGVH
jgi:ABC-type glycerol-3-phosphate transport system substrate-binding protein